MNKYVLATINEGGFIHTVPRQWDCVHKETVFPIGHEHLHSCWEAVVALRHDEQLILKLGDDGRACEIWVDPDHEDTVRNRLKRWAGCYGGWTVRKLSKEKEATLSPH